jgi:hypothetical protein
MDVEQYVAARYGRLLERAIELGAPEGLASEYVDQVLLDQRRKIKRADDPDPVVLAALQRAITGQPARRSWAAPVVAVALVGVAVVVGVALTYQPSGRPLPSMFGYHGDEAARLLDQQGYNVVVRQSKACEPIGQVLGTRPRAGEKVETGTTVAVYIAIPSGYECEPKYLNRSDAWEFVRFALDDRARPRFTETVSLVVDGSPPTRISGVTPQDDVQWDGPRRLVAEAATATVESGTGMAELTVTDLVPPSFTCGIPRPAEAGERRALRLEIDTRRRGEDRGCPLTVDLYRVGRVIDSVVIYRSAAPAARDSTLTSE